MSISVSLRESLSNQRTPPVRCDAVGDVPGQLAVERAFLEGLAAPVDEVLVAGDRVLDARREGIPPALEAAQEAVLRRGQVLVLVPEADDVVEAAPGLRHEPQLLDQRLVAPGADGRGHRPRVVVVEGQETGLGVEAGVLAGAVAASGRSRTSRTSASRSRGRCSSRGRRARRRASRARAGSSRSRSRDTAVPKPSVPGVGCRRPPTSSDCAKKDSVASNVSDGSQRAARRPYHISTVVRVLLAPVLRRRVEHAVRRHRQAVVVEHVEVHVVGDARVVRQRQVEAHRERLAHAAC